MNAEDLKPIDMILHCPSCGKQHIDGPGSNSRWANHEHPPTGPKGEWTNPPHRSHLCHFCGQIWRPADVPTNGVQAIQTRGEHDGIVLPSAALAAQAAPAGVQDEATEAACDAIRRAVDLTQRDPDDERHDDGRALALEIWSKAFSAFNAARQQESAAAPATGALCKACGKTHELGINSEGICFGCNYESPATGAQDLREAFQQLVSLEDQRIRLRIRLRMLHESGFGTDRDRYHKAVLDAWAKARAARQQESAR